MLIRCKTCGKNVSSSANFCPHCGETSFKKYLALTCDCCNGAGELEFKVTQENVSTGKRTKDPDIESYIIQCPGCYGRGTMDGYDGDNISRYYIFDALKGVNDISKYTLLRTIKREKNGGGCFITTSVCQTLNKPDDCIELNTLRKFRDEYLSINPNYRDMVHHYYDIAPKMVDKLEQHNDKNNISHKLYDKFLKGIIENYNAPQNQDHQTNSLYSIKLRYFS